MVKALKVVMIVFGVLLVLMGLINLIIPAQFGEMHGMREVSSYVMWMVASLGAISITVGFWVIVAGRDPLRHINWVKFVITWCLLALVVHIYSIIKGYVSFSQIPGFIIVDAVFAVALLALYPWRAGKSDVD